MDIKKWHEILDGAPVADFDPPLLEMEPEKTYQVIFPRELNIEAYLDWKGVSGDWDKRNIVLGMASLHFTSVDEAVAFHLRFGGRLVERTR